MPDAAQSKTLLKKMVVFFRGENVLAVETSKALAEADVRKLTWLFSGAEIIDA